MNPRFRYYSFAVGTAFWVPLAAAIAFHPGGLGSLHRMAALIALAIVGEELVVRQRQTGGETAISFSAAAHVAAALLLMPMAAAVTAAAGVLLGDGLRRDGRRFLLINSAMFGGATWIASLIAHRLLDGGHLGLAAAPALVLVLAARYAVTTAVFSGGLAALGSGTFFKLLRDAGVAEVSSAVGEGSLGILVAAGFADRVILPFLVPLFIALYAAKANLQRLRTETQHALDAIADVIDARDPSTYAHSERVAEYMQQFVDALELPTATRELLVSTARYHDLGKVGVDASTLRSAAALTAEEVREIRQHPRLSAQLLRPFSFARQMAVFAELHHERFDSKGYYGVAAHDIPMAAHVLIVADSFDAMTSARPYRPGLTVEEAVREVLDKAGTQFHPLAARAFAAVVTGDQLGKHLELSELQQLRKELCARPSDGRRLWVVADARNFVIAGGLLSLSLVGLSWVPVYALAVPALGAAAVAAAGVVRDRRLRGRRGAFDSALAAGFEPSAALAAAGFVGSAGWLPLELGPNGLPPTFKGGGGVELQSAGRRSDAQRVVTVSDGTVGVFSGLVRAGRHFVVVLQRPPSRAELNLVQDIAAALAGRGPDPTTPVRETLFRGQAGRAVVLVDLQAFERLRVGAGQLVAEQVVAEVRSSVRGALRQQDAVLGLDHDRFVISTLTSDGSKLDALVERMREIMRQVQVPARLAPIEPRIVVAPAGTAKDNPELAAIEALILPEAIVKGSEHR